MLVLLEIKTVLLRSEQLLRMLLFLGKRKVLLLNQLLFLGKVLETELVQIMAQILRLEIHLHYQIGLLSKISELVMIVRKRPSGIQSEKL